MIGDKEHSIITKLVGKIVEDKEEVLNNLDPSISNLYFLSTLVFFLIIKMVSDDLDEFNEIWDYVLSQESLVGVMKWKCKDIWNKFRSCMLCTQLTEPTYRLLI